MNRFRAWQLVNIIQDVPYTTTYKRDKEVVYEEFARGTGFFK